MNSLPSAKESRRGTLPAALEAPFLVGEMLDERERQEFRAVYGPTVYEELS